jgi:hypothetical protein
LASTFPAAGIAGFVFSWNIAMEKLLKQPGEENWFDTGNLDVHCHLETEFDQENCALLLYT